MTRIIMIIVMLLIYRYWSSFAKCKVFHNIIYSVAAPLAFSNKLPQRLLSKAIKFEFPPNSRERELSQKFLAKGHQIGISTPFPILLSQKKNPAKTDNVKKWKCVSPPLSKVPCIATPVKARKCSPSHHWRQIHWWWWWWWWWRWWWWCWQWRWWAGRWSIVMGKAWVYQDWWRGVWVWENIWI